MPALANTPAALFLWVPSPQIRAGNKVVEAWGFEFKSSAVWDKEIAGNGYWFRQQHELLYIATRGDMPAAPTSARVPSVIRSRRREHSRKPDEVYGIIERMYPGLPKVELFARSRSTVRKSDPASWKLVMPWLRHSRSASSICRVR